MMTTRREFVKGHWRRRCRRRHRRSARAVGAQAARTTGITTLAFDAYGTLFDVFSVTALCEELFPGQGDTADTALARPSSCNTAPYAA